MPIRRVFLDSFQLITSQLWVKMQEQIYNWGNSNISKRMRWSIKKNLTRVFLMI